MIARIRGLDFSGESIKQLRVDLLERLFESYHHRFTAQRNLSTIQFLGGIIREIETEVRSQIQLRKDFQLLLTTPGIGLILGLTIMLEVGDITRFPKSEITPPTAAALRARELPTTRKRVKATRKTVTGTWRGPM